MDTYDKTWQEAIEEALGIYPDDPKLHCPEWGSLIVRQLLEEKKRCQDELRKERSRCQDEIHELRSLVCACQAQVMGASVALSSLGVPVVVDGRGRSLETRIAELGKRKDK